MTPQAAIIVISDVHAGPDSPYAELRTSATSATLSSPHYSLAALAEAIERVTTDVPAKNRVLLCTGDLSARCHSLELAAAARWLTDVAKAVKIPKRQRLLVPGNHDIDWPLTNLAKDDPWYDQYRQQKLVDNLKTHAPTFKFPAEGKPLEVKLLDDRLRFYLLDSAHEDRVQQDPHRGAIGPAQLQALEALLSTPTAAVRCVALHHHIAAIAPTHGSPDFSILQDASDLLSTLRKHRVPLLFHGHQHFPFFQQLSVGGPSLHIVSSGSTTAAHTRLPRDIPNTFHVLTLDSLASEDLRGSLHTRMFTIANGWQMPSRRFHQIGARRPFGPVFQPPDIDTWITEALSACQESKLVPLDTFLARKPNGLYFCPHAFGDAIRAKLDRQNESQAYDILCSDDDRVILTLKAQQ